MPGHVVCPVRIITMLASDMTAKPGRPVRSRKAKPGRPGKTSEPHGDPAVVPDGFYRDMVWNLRNGVIAITNDGRVAVMNEIAYRTLGLKPRVTDIGRQYVDVLKDAPDVIRILAGAFALSHVKDARGRDAGATLFFKDLTRVEQLEERERLRDRLAALGEMAAAIAHEVKNPLAGIEVMAGLLKRQLAGNEDALSILTDIIKEAKMANAIVIEVLDFVRPIRLQVEHVSVSDVVR